MKKSAKEKTTWLRICGCGKLFSMMEKSFLWRRHADTSEREEEKELKPDKLAMAFRRFSFILLILFTVFWAV